MSLRTWWIWPLGLLLIAVAVAYTQRTQLDVYVEQAIRPAVAMRLAEHDLADVPYTVLGRNVMLHLQGRDLGEMSEQQLRASIASVPGVGTVTGLQVGEDLNGTATQQANSSAPRFHAEALYDGKSLTLIGTGANDRATAQLFALNNTDEQWLLNDYMRYTESAFEEQWLAVFGVWVSSLKDFSRARLVFSESGVWVDGTESRPGGSDSLVQLLSQQDLALPLLHAQNGIVSEGVQAGGTLQVSTSTSSSSAPTSGGASTSNIVQANSAEVRQCNAELAALTAASPISFQRGSASVASSSIETLIKVRTVLANCAQARLTIAGYTDSRGDESMNLALSRQRALSVRDELLSLGLLEEQVEAVGFGEANPIASNDTSEGRAINRRIEMTVSQ